MTNKIPKIIHYCWFGGSPLPESVIHYIKTWKKYCPDYEIREWNENNFDVNICQFTREAYEKKKWAYIADYARLYALVNYGGIYLDTDVEICKSLDPFLAYDAFMGFERSDILSTAIIGSKKEFSLLKDMLDQYEKKHFVKTDGTLDLTPNPQLLTEICISKGLVPNNKFQIINGLAIYPTEVFSPKDYQSGKVTTTENTVTIHHFEGSWINKNLKRAQQIKEKFGDNLLGKIISFPFIFRSIVNDSGYKVAFSHYLNKLKLLF